MYLTELLFCDKRKFKPLYMAIMIRNGQKRNKLHDMNFQMILRPEVILAKVLSQKIYSLGPFLSFKYARYSSRKKCALSIRTQFE